MPELASGRMAELVALLDSGEPATANGRLFAVDEPMGHHPAMIAGEDTVHGRLHRVGLRFGAAELAEMDAYEGADYARRPIVARTQGGSEVPCEAYLWLGPTDVLDQIPHGDFARYLAESGAPALPG